MTARLPLFGAYQHLAFLWAGAVLYFRRWYWHLVDENLQQPSEGLIINIMNSGGQIRKNPYLEVIQNYI